ncbi:DUF2796 domain-containing protein [Photobacterium rosenbergii]|uniref:DUF2796 domain-containing protein n=1 Tax=Photobacterium rosenbergii TaxID=294936 RepID=A0A2T3NAE4_9GAMM|nr:DUF2796 domain-containing protein [Photobacterium rosenbergii]PSW10614.1 DUF2796 domain-containing protein [Photobacterium rosenbergii]
MRLNHSLSPIATLFVTLGLAASGSAAADDHFRQHDAHVHGVVEVNIAQDGQDLLMEIHAPGADVVGFEHAPQTDEQKAAIENAIAKLKSPDSTWMLTANAKCQLVESQVTETLSSGSSDGHDHGDHDHDKHDHGDHGHDHDHDKHDHGDHGHDHDKHDHDDHGHDHDKHDHDDHGHDDHDHDHDHDHGAHGEFSAQYTYKCDNIEQLTDVKTQWFTHFPTTERITVNAITEKGQKGGSLTSSSITFRF